MSLELRHGKNNERIIVKIKKVRKKRERERERGGYNRRENADGRRVVIKMFGSKRPWQGRACWLVTIFSNIDPFGSVTSLKNL